MSSVTRQALEIAMLLSLVDAFSTSRTDEVVLQESVDKVTVSRADISKAMNFAQIDWLKAYGGTPVCVNTYSPEEQKARYKKKAEKLTKTAAKIKEKHCLGSCFITWKSLDCRMKGMQSCVNVPGYSSQSQQLLSAVIHDMSVGLKGNSYVQKSLEKSQCVLNVDNVAEMIKDAKVNGTDTIPEALMEELSADMFGESCEVDKAKMPAPYLGVNVVKEMRDKMFKLMKNSTFNQMQEQSDELLSSVLKKSQDIKDGESLLELETDVGFVTIFIVTCIVVAIVLAVSATISATLCNYQDSVGCR